MKKKSEILGTGVALVTPFSKNKKINFNALENIVKSISYSGINYIVTLGTTGELSTIIDNEKIDIINCIKSCNINNLPLILNIGGNNTNEIIKNIQSIDISFFYAVLLITPYYSKPSQEGLYQHFRHIAKNIDTKIIIYNVPSRTGSNILPKTVIKLAKEFNNIIGIKEASGNILQAYEIIKHKPIDFHVISGDDALSVPIIAGGGSGIISVIAQAIPSKFSNMIDLALVNKLPESFVLYYQIYDLIRLIFEEGNPVGIKALLEITGMCDSYLRLPLVEATKKLKKELYLEYKKIF